MKICLVSPSPRIVGPGQGGVENLLILWADEFTRRGHEVTVVSVTGKRRTHPPLPGSEWRRREIERAESLADMDADVWSIHQRPDWAARLPPLCTSVMVHNVPSRHGPFGIFPPARTWEDAIDLLRSSPHLVACSRWLADTLGRVTQRVDVGVVYPSVHPAFAAATARPHERIVLVAGRLLRRKGLDRVAELARAGCLDAPLVVTDFAPPSVPAAEAQAVRTTVRSARGVHLVPPATSPQAMADLMAGAGVVVVPSIDEPFGMVSIEAQAAGARIVGWDSGGFPETAGPGVSLVTGTDSDGFAAAINAAITSPRVPEAWRTRAGVRWSAARSVDTLLSSIPSLLAHPDAPECGDVPA